MRFGLLTTVAALALTAGSASAATVTQDISFTASDGVVLHATIGGEGSIDKRPLIIEDSPYAPGVTQYFGPAYNYIQLQWRGTGRSGGSLTKTGLRDQQDYSEFISWACRQPWSDGNIGLYGFSASAIAVYNALHLPMPCVKAAALMAGTVDLYRDLLYIGGVNNAAPALYVLGAIGAPWLQNSFTRLREQPQSIPDSAYGFGSAIPDTLQHTTEDAYWLDKTFQGNANHIPLLADTGFYDVEARGPFLAYKQTQQDGSHLLVIGAHDGYPAGTGGQFPHYQRWFDHYVRGIDNGVEDQKPVDLYLSNGSREELLAGHFTRLQGEDWPLPGTKYTRLYLSAARSGTANSLNDGTLALTNDATTSAQHYPFHPSDSFATNPHTIATVAGLGLDQFATYFPQITRMDFAEPTALTYTTAPLKQAINAVGPGSLDVFASTTAPDSDLLAVIADVWEDGTAHPVATGILKTSFPKVVAEKSLTDPVTHDLVQPYTDFSAKDLALPGTTREYHIELVPIGNHFGAGHRIRLYIVGTPADEQPSLPGVNTVSLGGLSPSRLIMPTAAGPDLTQGLG